MIKFSNLFINLIAIEFMNTDYNNSGVKSIMTLYEHVFLRDI